MGFWQGLGRLASGKPVFQDDTGLAVPPANTPPAAVAPALVDAHGYKIIPTIELTHLTSHLSGDTLTITAWTANRSDQRIRIDSFEMLGSKRIIRRELDPAQAHELTLYQGPVPHEDHHTRAQLEFCLLVDDDLFELIYYIKFRREPGGTYLVDELRLDGPPRDI